MNSREEIQELNDHLQAFPKAEDIFVKDQPWLKNHFLPLMSIDLAEINPEWEGQKVYMMCPFEPYEGYIGDNTTEYHNEYTAPNWLAFRLTDDNKFEFLGKEGYFERTAIHNWDFDSKEEELFQEMADNYEKSKANVAKYGTLVNLRYPEYNGKLNRKDEEYPKAFKMHIEDGEEDDEVVFDISYKGNPFYLISEATAFHWVGAGGYIIMMYEPVSRIVLFTFDYS